jgi:hypothetical protein
MGEHNQINEIVGNDIDSKDKIKIKAKKPLGQGNSPFKLNKANLYEQTSLI